MKVKINEELCTVDGLCSDACPEVFAVENEATKVKSEIVPKEFEEKCREAAEGCPSEAIIIED